MAKEATHQVVRDRQTVDRVHRFTMQDVVFLKPLTIPGSPRRIEVQLTLNTRHALISNLRGWNDFLAVVSFERRSLERALPRTDVLLDSMTIHTSPLGFSFGTITIP